MIRGLLLLHLIALRCYTSGMTTRTIPQAWCRDQLDHPAHYWPTEAPTHRCPGRITPSHYRMPAPSPVPGWTKDDPFAGLD